MAKKTSPKLKTNIHNIFATDKRQEEEGAWVKINALQGLEVKVRRMRSDFATKAYEKLIQERFGEQMARNPGKMDNDETMALLSEHLAVNILADWKNLRDTETGNLIPYDTEIAIELMSIPDFRDFVLQAAQERDTFREKADEEAEGN